MSNTPSYAEAIFEAVDHPLVVLDADLHIQLANQAFCDAFGLSKGEVEQRSISQLGEGQWNRPELRKGLEAVLTQNQPFANFQMPWPQPGGTSTCMLLSARPVQQGRQEPTGILLSIRDVTAEREAERRLTRHMLTAQSLLRLMTLASETDSMEQVLERSVDAVCEVIGWPVGHVFLVPSAEAEALVSTSIWRFSGNVDYALLADATERCRFSCGAGLPGRAWREQRLVWIENLAQANDLLRGKVCRQLGLAAAFAFPLHVDGRTRAILEFFHDQVTPPSEETLRFCQGVAEPVGQMIERSETTARLQQAAQEAEHANRIRGEFLANVSHELRTPMNAILGMLQLALDEELSPVLRDYLQTAKHSADSLLTLLNDILDFSKLDAGQFTIESEPFELREILDEAMKALSTRAFEKGLELLCDLPPDVPEQLIGDGLRLRQIITNLVNNAIKFTDAGEVVVQVALERELGQNVRLRFCVADTGLGISQTDQDRIFAPFTQVDASSTRQHGGTGLGLSICQKLLRRMGSRLQVHSELGKGSEFFFSLMLRRPARSLPTTPTLSLDRLRELRVLVVDDNETNRRILEQILQSWSMRAETAQGGEQALDKLRQAEAAGQPYPLILVDALMPGMDGFRLAQHVTDPQQIATPPSIILMISSTDRQLFSERSDTPIAAYLQKPISSSDLMNAIMVSLNVQTPTLPWSADLSHPQSASRPLAILLAEDTSANQKVVTSVLEKRGHAVTVAQNGREAVDLFGSQSFDVVLMDVQMPIMDGLQATIAIRELERNASRSTPIVAMTAHAMKGDRERCLEAGMDAYLAKPISVPELIEIVESVADELTVDELPGPATAGTEPSPGAVSSQATLVDLPGALQRLGGDLELFREFIAFFEEDAPQLLDRIATAIERQDAAEVRRNAHSLKGLVSNFGAQETADLAFQMESYGKAGEIQQAAAALRQLQASVEQLRGDLSIYRAV